MSNDIIYYSNWLTKLYDLWSRNLIKDEPLTNLPKTKNGKETKKYCKCGVEIDSRAKMCKKCLARQKHENALERAKMLIMEAVSKGYFTKRQLWAELNNKVNKTVFEEAYSELKRNGYLKGK